jgi:hypothetical protein
MMPADATRPNIEVDRPFASKVEAMAGFGLPAADIALVLAMDLDELQSIYQRELETGTIKTNLRVAERLYQQALGDGRQAVTAAIFWLKTRARWKETQPEEQASTLTPTINFNVIYEPKPDMDAAEPRLRHGPSGKLIDV